MSVPYTAIARYQYDPDPENASDDLPLRVDDLITVTEIVDDDWLLGSKKDASGNQLSGYFPRGFVEAYSEPAPPAPIVPETPSPVITVTPEIEKDEVEPYIEEKSPKEAAETVSESSPTQQDFKDIESNIIHEPENFKNKLQSFNTVSNPLVPMSIPKEDSYVKKSFITAEHRSSYVPPSLGTPKKERKEERKPDVVSGEIISETSFAEEVEAPRMTLKERMQLLQKQQEEEQKALEAALKRKEERKKSKHQNVNESQTHDSDIPASIVSGNTLDDYEDTVSNIAPPVPEAAESILDNYTQEDENAENDKEEENEVEETDQDADENEDEDEDEEESDDDEEDEDEEDEEELRKRKLAERMAKLSGGMGMMGMMGMMPSAPPVSSKTKKKKSKKEKKPTSQEPKDAPVAIPILPMSIPGVAPIMGMPLPEKVLSNEPTEEAKEIIEDVNEDVASIQPSEIPESSILNDSTDDEEYQDTNTHNKEENPELEELKTPSMESHPYRAHFASPAVNVPTPTTTAPPVPTNVPTPTTTAPPVPTNAPAPPVPLVPGSIPAPLAHTKAPTIAEVRIPPPPPPTTTPPPATSTNIPVAISDAPSIPSSIPPPMPETIPPTERPPMPPPTTTSALPPAPISAIPPPIPGSVPTLPTPTQAPQIPAEVHSPIPAHVPIANAESRHSSVSSRPSIPSSVAPPAPTTGGIYRKASIHSHHAPPPPPPPPTHAPVPNDIAPPIPPVVRQLTRTSLDSSASSPVTGSAVSNNNELWWTSESLPPQLRNTENYFEVETTEIKKRNEKTVIYLVYYILDVHLACSTLELAYDTSDPERILFFHESKDKFKPESNVLIDQYTKFGPLAYNSAVKSLNKSFDGEFISFIFSNLPKNVLLPIANKTFGAVVYRNNNGDCKSYEEIRPGDILVLVHAEFENHGVDRVGFDKPHVAIITNYDTVKNKIKVIEQSNGVVQQGRYKLNKMKSGKLRVFRIVGRDYVGW